MTTTAYRTLFQDYLGAGLQLVLAQVQAAEPLVPDDLRRQAWHLLSYAFESDAAWPIARDLLLALAPKMEQAGFRDEWIVYLKQGLQYAYAYGELQTVAELHLYLGQLYRLLSQLELATQQLTDASAHFAELGDQRNLVRALNEQAWLAYLQHEYEQASMLAQQAIETCASNEAELGRSHRILGMIAIEYGRWHEAESEHRIALSYFESQGDLRMIAWGLQNLASAIRSQKERLAEVIFHYRRAIEILNRIGDGYHSAIAEMNLGIAFSLAGCSTEAVARYQAAGDIFRKLHDKLYVCRIQTNLGIEHLALGECEQAESEFTLAAQLYHQLGDEAWRLNALDGLALTHLRRKQYDRALQVLEEAVAQLPAVADKPNYEYLYRSLTGHLQEAQQGQSLSKAR